MDVLYITFISLYRTTRQTIIFCGFLEGKLSVLCVGEDGEMDGKMILMVVGYVSD